MSLRSINQKKRDEHLTEMNQELDRISSYFEEQGAERIIHFGSHAKDQAVLTSDLDIFVVIPSEVPFIERTINAYKALLPKIESDIIIYTPEEYERNIDRPFLKEIHKTGRLIYEK